MLALTLTCCATSFSQRIVETLPDDSFIVEIAGKEYRAINADKVREIQKAKIDLDTAQRINSEKDKAIEIQAQEIALLKKDVEIVGLKAQSFEADFKRSREDAARNLSLFESERALRVEASGFIPKGNAHGFWGHVLDALNSQPAQVAFKVGLPIFTAMRCQ